MMNKKGAELYECSSLSVMVKRVQEELRIC